MSITDDKVHSLMSKSDRGDKVYKSDMRSPPLTEEEVDIAMKTLNDTSFVDKFPKIERQYADPAISLQTYGLVSFVPSKGATPDKDGVFGFAKIRGNYASQPEANERAEYIIRNVDSYHKIFQAYVGRPFPITVDEKYCANTEEVDIRKKATETISEDVKAKRDYQKKEIDEIKEREKRLLEEAKSDYEEDPFEKYVTLRVKKAQLVWGYKNTMDQLNKMKDVIIKTRVDITEQDALNPDFSSKHYDRYMSARKDAGLPDDMNTEDNFIKYLCEDVDLGF
jgi:hypothetical protein